MLCIKYMFNFIFFLTERKKIINNVEILHGNTHCINAVNTNSRQTRDEVRNILRKKFCK